MPQTAKTAVFALDFFSDRSAMEELLGARVLSAATRPRRGFAAQLVRDFLMAGFDASGCDSDFFPCTGAWNSPVCRVSSARCCGIEAHGEAAIVRKQPALASALRLAATPPLWPRLSLTALARCQPASSADAGETEKAACAAAAQQWRQSHGWSCGVGGGGACF